MFLERNSARMAASRCANAQKTTTATSARSVRRDSSVVFWLTLYIDILDRDGCTAVLDGKTVSLCQHGTCQLVDGKPACSCQSGWSGIDCSIGNVAIMTEVDSISSFFIKKKHVSLADKRSVLTTKACRWSPDDNMCGDEPNMSCFPIDPNCLQGTNTCDNAGWCLPVDFVAMPPSRKAMRRFNFANSNRRFV